MSDHRLRLATGGDAAEVRAIYAPYVETTAITFEEIVPSSAEMTRRIEETLAERPWLVCESARGLDGFAYAAPFRARPAYRFSVETTVYVREAGRGLGVGSALARSLLAVLRLQGYRLAVAGIALPNEASVRLHESLGFEQIGVLRRVGFKLGRWHDVGWWAHELQRLGDEPPAPRPLAGLRDEPALSAAIAAGAKWIGSGA